MYKCICNCGKTYIGETIRNVEERWAKHNSTDHKSEPSKHLADNDEHSFFWRIFLAAPEDARKPKSLEVFFIAKWRPYLNKQEKSNMLTVFKSGLA